MPERERLDDIAMAHSFYVQARARNSWPAAAAWARALRTAQELAHIELVPYQELADVIELGEAEDERRTA